MRGVIGMDLHRTFAEVVAWEDGRLRHAARVDVTRSGLEGFARSLQKTDEVVIEATVAEEAEPARGMERGQTGEEQPAEQLAEHVHRQEQGRPRGDPPRAVERDPAARHDHVDVRVVGQREPQVWSTAVMPMRAPRWRGSAAIVSMVSDAVRNSRS